MRPKRAFWIGSAVAVLILAVCATAIIRQVRRPRFATATADLKRSLVAAALGRSEVLDRGNASLLHVVPPVPPLAPTRTVRFIASDGRLTFAVPNGYIVDVSSSSSQPGRVTFGPAGASTPSHPPANQTASPGFPNLDTLFAVVADPTDVNCPGALSDYGFSFRSASADDHPIKYRPGVLIVRLHPPLQPLAVVLAMPRELDPILRAVTEATGSEPAALRAIELADTGLTDLGDQAFFAAVADARWADAIAAKTPTDFARASVLLHAKTSIRYFDDDLGQVSNGRRSAFLWSGGRYRDHSEYGFLYFDDGRFAGEGHIQCQEPDYPSALAVVRTVFLGDVPASP